MLKRIAEGIKTKKAITKSMLPKDEIEKKYNSALVIRLNDESKAFNLFHELAELEHKFSAYMVGQYYQYGLGVEVDIQKAIKWYLKSIEYGYEEGTYFVARAYWMAGNKEQSHHYFDLCVVEGDMVALSYLGFAYMGLNDWDEVDVGKAIYYHKKAGENGHIVSALHYYKFLIQGHQGFWKRFPAFFKYIKVLILFIGVYLQNDEDARVCIQSTVLCEKYDCWNRFL